MWHAACNQYSMNITGFVKEFSKMTATEQTAVLVGTDWAALWSALREHYKGSVILADDFMPRWSDEARRAWHNDPRTFRREFGGLNARIRDLERHAALVDARG